MPCAHTFLQNRKQLTRTQKKSERTKARTHAPNKQKRVSFATEITNECWERGVFNDTGGVRKPPVGEFDQHSHGGFLPTLRRLVSNRKPGVFPNGPKFVPKGTTHTPKLPKLFTGVPPKNGSISFGQSDRNTTNKPFVVTRAKYPRVRV
mmetsp:Transcript_55257/g.66535  ORF Transcript_55257/g.66535 Transcript_55257/m.66535 type:complete len:149 (-) Transcript_55257:75-521(-)